MKTLIPDSLPIPTDKQELSSLSNAIKAYCKKCLMTQKEIKTLFKAMDDCEDFNPKAFASYWMAGKMFRDDRPRFEACLKQYAQIRRNQFKREILKGLWR
jgi:hypothetical protein